MKVTWQLVVIQFFDDMIFTDANLFLGNNVTIVDCKSLNFNQQSQCITNDIISPNIETELSNLIDLRRQNINNPMIG